MRAPRYPEISVQQVYLKPLIPKGFDRLVDPEHALRILQRDLLKRMRTAFKLQDAFSQRARAALAKSLKVRVMKSSIRVSTRHPAFRPLVLGMTSRQMTWLTKAKKPIPIITETGELIFRRATAKSMADGRWIHPGHPPTDLLDKARRESREYVKQRVTEEVQRQLRQALKKAAA